MCLVLKIKSDTVKKNCTGTWNVQSMNQGKLELLEQEMGILNISILGVRELKWMGMGQFNSEDHYIFYCGQESLRRNGVAIIDNKIHTSLCSSPALFEMLYLGISKQLNELS